MAPNLRRIMNLVLAGKGLVGPRVGDPNWQYGTTRSQRSGGRGGLFPPSTFIEQQVDEVGGLVVADYMTVSIDAADASKAVRSYRLQGGAYA